ncbi:Inosine-uridine preferring nucleoside hydrolase family protein [Tritrichomonas foetus]|uniref:Inosine-uridine preferring nucleoside hydrolase family protein n=1 Tax=Tritrichomonas foetus TaxID=1144522 RepID=A0A1J4KPY1_9EUKA|nr:Inosine-uridine preferring nucleoside hydrolase family protein [Tritrichomonas foetus]|eukprot:OHT13170.1 Inosine-uridine preferring nucleoside hydrolase family protein [Tritrichomonas foetus]
MSRTKCILDCDPGHDDLAAIMLMVCSDKLDPQFISTTHGNQTVNKTYQNARRTLNLIKRADKIPVYRGFSRPLVRESVACPEIHGESGLGGVDWEPIDATMPRNPVLDLLGYKTEDELQPTDFYKHLHQLISEVPEGERFQVITTGSMTNIAQYLLAYPNDAKKMTVTSMAGNFMVVGNITSFAEFNVLIDPEANDIVVKSEAEMIFAAPLDITHTVLVDSKVMEMIKEATEPHSPLFYNMISSLLMFFKDAYLHVFGFESPPLHDPVAVFYLLHPECFESEKCHVDIETKGEFTYGACCHDLLMKKKDPSKAKPANVTVCLKLKEGGHEIFWKEMCRAFNLIAKEVGQ